MGRRFFSSCEVRRLANIQKVLGKHVLIEGYREVPFTKERRPTLKCVNCARTWDLERKEESSIKYDCISDINLSRLGPTAQKIQLERDMRGGLYR